jgi:molybdopterin-guanine dinucleotide biosynthesis protein A
VALYRRTLAGPLADFVSRGERRLQAILALPRVRRIEADDLRVLDPDGESFRSLNTPAEYAAAVAAWWSAAPR